MSTGEPVHGRARGLALGLGEPHGSVGAQEELVQITWGAWLPLPYLDSMISRVLSVSDGAVHPRTSHRDHSARPGYHPIYSLCHLWPLITMVVITRCMEGGSLISGCGAQFLMFVIPLGIWSILTGQDHPGVAQEELLNSWAYLPCSPPRWAGWGGQDHRCMCEHACMNVRERVWGGGERAEGGEGGRRCSWRRTSSGKEEEEGQDAV